MEPGAEHFGEARWESFDDGLKRELTKRLREAYPAHFAHARHMEAVQQAEELVCSLFRAYVSERSSTWLRLRNAGMPVPPLAEVTPEDLVDESGANDRFLDYLLGRDAATQPSDAELQMADDLERWRRHHRPWV